MSPSPSLSSTPPQPHHQSLHRSISIHAKDDHDGANDGGRHKVLRKLYMAASLCSIFFLVEVIGGYLAGSLAILSDASHLFADLASFGVAIVASHLASLPSTTKHTFGLRRAESLAALISMSSLAVVSIGLALEAIRRLYVMVSTNRNTEEQPHPQQQVDGTIMSIIAAIGVVVNILLALILGAEHIHMPGASDEHDHDHNQSHVKHDDDDDDHHDHNHEKEVPATTHDHDHHNHSHHHEHDSHEEQSLLSPTQTSATYDAAASHDDPRHYEGDVASKKEENINLKAAYLHVLGDLAQSLAVLIAGIILWIFPQAQIVDPLCTLLFCVLVFYSTLSILRSSVAVLLEEIPPQVDWMKVYEAISAVPDVTDAHDLHIWCISHGEPSLSVHCVTHRPDIDQALADIYKVCQQFGIHHATIQLQRSTDYCLTCAPSATV